MKISLRDNTGLRAQLAHHLRPIFGLVFHFPCHPATSEGFTLLHRANANPPFLWSTSDRYTAPVCLFINYVRDRQAEIESHQKSVQAEWKKLKLELLSSLCLCSSSSLQVKDNLVPQPPFISKRRKQEPIPPGLLKHCQWHNGPMD